MARRSTARTPDTNGSGVSQTCGVDIPPRPPPSSPCQSDSHSGSRPSRHRRVRSAHAQRVGDLAFKRLLDDQPQREAGRSAPPPSPDLRSSSRELPRVRSGADSLCCIGMLPGASGANRKPASCCNSGRVHPNPVFQQAYASPCHGAHRVRMNALSAPHPRRAVVRNGLRQLAALAQAAKGNVAAKVRSIAIWHGLLLSTPRGRFESMPRDEPSFIVAPGECDELGAQFLDCFERPHPEQVFLQGSDKAFGDAVALGFEHEGRRSFDAQTFDLVLEIAGQVIGAMIVTQLEPTRHAGRDGAEALGALRRRLIPLTQGNLHVVAGRRRRSDFCSGFRAR